MQNRNNQTYLDQDNLRLEVAILQENIKSQDPGEANFKIPAIMTGEKIGTVYTPTKNSANKKIYKGTTTKTTFDDEITLKIPLEYTAFFGKRIVPKGTKFIVAFIGGDINNIRIVGRYDY